MPNSTSTRSTVAGFSLEPNCALDLLLFMNSVQWLSGSSKNAVYWDSSPIINSVANTGNSNK
eukprot:2252138-Rhodomonas_salina.1